MEPEGSTPHSQGLSNNPYPEPNQPNSSYCRVIKPRTFRWEGHLARMEEGRSAFEILTGKPTGK